jgi:Zinc knuckle
MTVSCVSTSKSQSQYYIQTLIEIAIMDLGRSNRPTPDLIKQTQFLEKNHCRTTPEGGNIQDDDIPKTRKCFHCGKLGHMVSSCPHHLEPQTKDGKSAIQDPSSKSTRRYRLYHFYKFQTWFQQHITTTETRTNSLSQSTMVLEEKSNISSNEVNLLHFSPSDPITMAYHVWTDPIVSKEPHHRTLRKHCFHSYREYFNYMVSQWDIPSSTSSHTQEGIHYPWKQILHQAVKDGTPADFSNSKALRTYTIERWIPRCRQLFYILMDHPPNIISQSIRMNLWKSFFLSSNVASLQICSLGGGPGLDHIAFCLAVGYLQHFQRQQQIYPKHHSVSIRTQVMDLWYDAWKSVAEEWNEALRKVITLSPFTEMTLHPADLRLSFDATINQSLASAIENADIIVAQYVLHENATYFMSERGENYNEPEDTTDNKTLCTKTSLVNILQCAKIGAIMVCTDSIHTLWPIIQSEASDLGWISQSNADQEHPILMGPASYLLLKRV